MMVGLVLMWLAPRPSTWRAGLKSFPKFLIFFRGLTLDGPAVRGNRRNPWNGTGRIAKLHLRPWPPPFEMYGSLYGAMVYPVGQGSAVPVPILMPKANTDIIDHVRVVEIDAARGEGQCVPIIPDFQIFSIKCRIARIDMPPHLVGLTKDDV